METIMLNGTDYRTAEELHSALKILLSLPDHYGKNADALNDCLSERKDPVSLWIAGRGEGDVARAMELISRVIADNGGAVKEI